MPARREVEVEVEGRRLTLSNLDKVLYPEAGFTKGQVVDYYRRVAPVLLAHLEGRALTLDRYPDGVTGEHFFEKRCPPHRPPWVHTREVLSSRRGQTVCHCIVDDLPTLVWVANLATLELHVPMARAEAPLCPTAIVLDLDPGPGRDLLDCADVACDLRRLLDELGLQAFAKSSGSKGIHVYVPLNTPATYDETAPFARALGEILGRRRRGDVVTNMRKDLRGGKVLVDWSQNSLHKTTVAPYSLRATPRPRVSAPLSWEEVEAAVEAGDASSLVLGPEEVLARVERSGDLFAPVVQVRQRLPRPVTP